jgi:3-methyladenine DNA glycosylase/8-oxoguanine DNA glycosylase
LDTSVLKCAFWISLAITSTVQAQKKAEPDVHRKTPYSEELAFKNWALVQCIGLGVKAPEVRKAASAAANEYMEQGHIDAMPTLRPRH